MIAPDHERDAYPGFPRIMRRHVQAALAASSLVLGCSSQPQVHFTNTNLPDQCGGACPSATLCSLGTVRLGAFCQTEGPIVCAPDAGGSCSGMCVEGFCAGVPSGCSATDCECIVAKMCPDKNGQTGMPCGGFCNVVGNYAQVACLSCN